MLIENSKDGISNQDSIAQAILNAVQDASTKTFVEGLIQDILRSEKLMSSKESKAHQYLYFATEKHLKAKGSGEFEEMPVFDKIMIKEVGNGMLKSCAMECFIMMEEGASIDEIEDTLKNDIGFSMGFWEMFEKLDDSLRGNASERQILLNTIAVNREKQVSNRLYLHSSKSLSTILT